MKREKAYAFRKEYEKPHKRIYPAKDCLPKKDELVIPDGVGIFAENSDVVLQTAMEDFAAYMRTAFGKKAYIVDSEENALIRITVDQKKLSGYMARTVTVDEKSVTILASDGRGAAQALYSLEDRMSARRAPFLEQVTTTESPVFHPRMIHSGYGMDVFPDGYLSVCAHYGYDAVVSYVRNEQDRAHLADLVKRAARYGIDVYAYSAFSNFIHPSDAGAKESYAEKYGGIFRDAPGLKGIVFVGESVEFPSKDPHVDPRPYTQPPKDGIPSGKPTPGWWPCCDYAEWITLIRDSIRSIAPEADIVFWTYNWGNKPEKDRLALIESLPTDISLQVTFEMFDRLHIGSSMAVVQDYTIAHPGPGRYFLSEAAVAKKRGIRLYTMANTAGRTWDFGVVPYEPFPARWNDRNLALLECHEKYGLSGLMESHHFGFAPSFIAKLASGTFTKGSKPFATRLREWATYLSSSDAEAVLGALALLDEAHTYYVPSDENQYGPYRIGPAFPFCLNRQLKFPNNPKMIYGNEIYNTLPVQSDTGVQSPYSLRVRDELARHKEARRLTQSALARLKSIRNRCAELNRLVNMVEFMLRCHITAVNFKEFYILRARLLNAATAEEIRGLVLRIERIILRERKNAIAAIPLVNKDSAIGYEPSMDYQCNEECINWKLRQLDFLMNNELAAYRI